PAATSGARPSRATSRTWRSRSTSQTRSRLQDSTSFPSPTCSGRARNCIEKVRQRCGAAATKTRTRKRPRDETRPPTRVPARALPRDAVAREPVRRSAWGVAAEPLALGARGDRTLVPVGARSFARARRRAARKATGRAVQKHLRVPPAPQRKEGRPDQAVPPDRVRLAPGREEESGNAQLWHEP